MDAKELIERISKGSINAIKTKENFLGLEASTYLNPELGPEYIFTVKLGEAMADAQNVVYLEKKIKELRKLSLKISSNKTTFSKKSSTGALDKVKLSDLSKKFPFGKKGSQRIDLLVFSSDDYYLPSVIMEIKIGTSNVGGIIKDIDRIVEIFDMFNDIRIEFKDTYGVIVFFYMKNDVYGKNGSVKNSDSACDDALQKIEEHLRKIRSNRDWIQSKFGLLKSGEIVQPAKGSHEVSEDGEGCSEFEKPGFRFYPVVIILGSNDEIAKIEL